MSPDLEIIMIAASILEKSGFRLICLWCYCLSANTTEPVVTCNRKSVELLQNDIDISGCVTSVWLKLFKNQMFLRFHFNGYSIWNIF